jgi:hypothetical protein
MPGLTPVRFGAAPREDVEVVGLRVGEPQRSRDSGQDVARGAWRPALFEQRCRGSGSRAGGISCHWGTACARSRRSVIRRI